jgi:chromosomal replication initiation ATPase DnaA
MVLYIDTQRCKKEKEFMYNLVEKVTGVEEALIKGSRGSDGVVLARRMFHYGLKSLTTLTLKEIGNETNNHYTSILAGLRYTAKWSKYKSPIENEYYEKVKYGIKKYKVKTSLNTIPS